MEAQEKDAAAISQILENGYFNNIYEGNANELGRVFYPGALLFGDVKGQPYKKTLIEYVAGVANRQSPRDSGKPFTGKIISIKVVNSIAFAEVMVKMYDFHYHEFLSFHKMDDQWYLVTKMLTDVSE